ncbi:hypothetical protein WR25_11246 [Diploscapter pachys]|uniref:Uncharacterized protein n=1 Tax=Diploscapter pachys TaxID=2018661 RepID=A0A2A2J4J0_9BILA|nr:hypothetical protein WR25_11246 [Diploscapter pachys]
MLNDVSKELSHTVKIQNQQVCSPTLALRHYVDGLAVVEICAKEGIDIQDMLEYLEAKLTFTHLGKDSRKC